MKSYRHKPTIVRAVQLSSPLFIGVLGGKIRGECGDYLILGVRGEQYFCKSDIFEEIYEPVMEVKKINE